jgi:predicted nucleic acid-binding protein
MIIVADSSPFVALINTGHVELLATLYGRIIIPPEVASELGSPKRTDEVRAFIATPPAWLEVRQPSSLESIAGLDNGELAAISLALELRADQLVIDETPGRRAALARNLRVIGTIGVLIAAAQRGLIDLEQAFEKIKLTDFWVSPRFLDERLALFREQASKHSGASGRSGV